MALSKRWQRQLYRSVRDLAIGYIILLTLIVMFEPYLLYKPMKGPSDPEAAGLTHYQLHTLPQAGGIPIIYWENAAAANAPTLIYFHGNAGGLFAYGGALSAFDKAGLHVIAMEYPGFPEGGAGRPSEGLIMAEARNLYDAVAKTHPRLIIWGFSLGTGVATQLAAERPLAMLILESPFTAVVDRAAELYPYIPVKMFMQNTFRSREFIAQNHAPLLILHGDKDAIVPIAEGKALFARANEPKAFHEYQEGGHGNLGHYGAYDDGIAFIHAHLSDAVASAKR